MDGVDEGAGPDSGISLELTSLENALREALALHGQGANASHDLAHTVRVWRNARLIAGREGQGDLRVLVAASYLHDLINVAKHHPDRSRASRLSAEAAAPILTEMGFTEAEVAEVGHAIEAHSFSAGIPAETLEARILQDADRLDSLGAIGIARMFTVSGGLGRPILDADDPFAVHRPLDDGRFAVDHYAVKLLKLAGMMQTGTGRALAEERSKRMIGFLRDLAGEIGAAYPEEFAGS